VRLPGEDCYPSEAARRPAVTSAASDDEPPDPGDVARLPVVGEIWASPPGLAVESISGYLPLPTGIVGREDGTFILTVRGDSMIGAGILPGDYVVVRPLYRPPRNGDIVVAILDGIEPEATVKTYLKAGRQVWLIPQNPAHLPIPGNRATFAGQVVAVLRQL
jgi:repressor LexA